jgi:hypothetical protein
MLTELQPRPEKGLKVHVCCKFCCKSEAQANP